MKKFSVLERIKVVLGHFGRIKVVLGHFGRIKVDLGQTNHGRFCVGRIKVDFVLGELKSF